MTSVRVSLVDVYVFRQTTPDAIELLTLRRGPSRSRPGSWETVHGHIEAGENPVVAAVRELREETGVAIERMYNLSRVEMFYQHGLDEIALIPVFAARVTGEAAVRLSDEHDSYEWLEAVGAAARFTWPRERRAVDDITQLLASGGAGSVEDVLAIDPKGWG
jgi:dATP pyrophosphohydrolase